MLFESKVMESRSGNEFKRWALGMFTSSRGGETEISSATGMGCESVRAAAWNLSNRRGPRTERFLRGVIRKGVQMGSIDSGVRYHVPDARIQVYGFDEPLELNLEAVVDGPKDAALAYAALVEDLCQAVSRGVYVQSPKLEPEATKENIEDIADINLEAEEEDIPF